MRKVSAYKCPHCGMKFKSLGGWNSHIEQLHSDKIPDGFTTSQYFYLILTGIGLDGPLCPICKERTPWNENTLKYARMCGKESCRKKAAEIAKQNMMKKYGKRHLLNDPDVQKKMLKGRRISGQYEFDDGIKFDYTGSYEKDFLIMLNEFLNWPSADLISPSPNVYKYIYQNKEHFYIPDFYIPSLNLEIEIKDGGDNPNNHWKIQAVDKVKEMEKDKVLNSRSDVNYIKVLNKDNSSFFEYLIKLKEENMVATESFITNCCPIVPYQGVIRDFDMEHNNDIENWIEKSISRFNENKYDELISNESFQFKDEIFDKIVEFNKKLNSMEYIIPFLDKPGNITADGHLNYYKMLTPKEFEKYNGGICWDYVAYEAWYFKKYFSNIKFKAYYAINVDDNDNPTHTFIIFEYDGYYYYFESSWKHNHGIFKFKTEKDALSYALKKCNDFYFEDHKDESKTYRGLYVAQYNPLDRKLFGMSCEEYMEYMSNLIKGPVKLPKSVKEPIEIFTEPLLYENTPYERK